MESVPGMVQASCGTISGWQDCQKWGLEFSFEVAEVMKRGLLGPWGYGGNFRAMPKLELADASDFAKQLLHAMVYADDSLHQAARGNGKAV